MVCNITYEKRAKAKQQPTTQQIVEIFPTEMKRATSSGFIIYYA
jgi:hypothetical protein